MPKKVYRIADAAGAYWSPVFADCIVPGAISVFSDKDEAEKFMREMQTTHKNRTFYLIEFEVREVKHS